MDKKKPEDCTIEELLSDVTYWEDPDTVLMVCSTRDGGAAIGEFDGNIWGEGKTLHEALVNFGKNYYSKRIYFDDDETIADWPTGRPA